MKMSMRIGKWTTKLRVYWLTIFLNGTVGSHCDITEFRLKYEFRMMSTGPLCVRILQGLPCCQSGQWGNGMWARTWKSQTLTPRRGFKSELHWGMSHRGNMFSLVYFLIKPSQSKINCCQLCLCAS